MFRRAIPILLGVPVLFAMSVSVRAKNDAGEAVTASIKLTAATSIGSTKLPAGDYKVEVEGSKAKFQQGSKVVAEVPCTVKDLNFKIVTTNFVIDHDQLTEIQVAGKSKAIELGGQ